MLGCSVIARDYDLREQRLFEPASPRRTVPIDMPSRDIPLKESVSSYQPMLRRVAHSLVSDSHAAEDLVQETWLTVLTHPPRDPRAMPAYVSRVLRRLASNQRRGEDRYLRRLDKVTPPSPPEKPDDRVLRTQAMQELSEALGQLDEETRQLLQLRFAEDLSPKEIALRFRCSVFTIHTRLRRAKERLRQILDRRNGGSRRAWTLLLLSLQDGEPLARSKPATDSGRRGKFGWLLLLGAVALLAVLRPWGRERVDEPRTRTAALEKPAERATAPEVSPSRVSAATSERPKSRLAPSDETPRFRLSGIVRQSGGLPVAGVPVFFGSPDDHQAFYSARDLEKWGLVLTRDRVPEDRPWLVTWSSEDGEFSFETSQPVVGWSLATLEPRLGAALEASLTLDDRTPNRHVELLLSGGTRVRGEVRNIRGKPVPRAQVHIEGVWSDALSTRSAPLVSLETNAEGLFESLPFQAEWFRVRISSPDGSLGYTSELQAKGVADFGVIALTAAQADPRGAIHGLEKLEEARRAISRLPAKFRDRFGALQVFTTRAVGDKLRSPEFARRHGVISWDRGQYSLSAEHVADGARVLLALYSEVIAEGVIRDGVLPDLILADFPQDLLEPRTLRIHVRDSVTGEAIPTFRVFLRRDRGLGEVLKQQEVPSLFSEDCRDGADIFGLAPARYLIWVEAEGFRSECSFVELRETTETTLEVGRTSCDLAVRVDSDVDWPATDLSVRLIYESGLPVTIGAGGRHLREGQMLFSNLVPGNYRLSVSPMAYPLAGDPPMPYRRSIELHPGDQELQVTVEKGTIPVRMKVVDSDQVPLERFQLVLGAIKDMMGILNGVVSGLEYRGGELELRLDPGQYIGYLHGSSLRSHPFQFVVPKADELPGGTFEFEVTVPW